LIYRTLCRVALCFGTVVRPLGAGSDPATLAATAVARRLSWIGTGLLSLIRGLGDRQTFTFFGLGPLNSPPYLAVKSREATITFRIMQRLALALTLVPMFAHAQGGDV
jgi:hypothetical protein